MPIVGTHGRGFAHTAAPLIAVLIIANAVGCGGSAASPAASSNAPGPSAVEQVPGNSAAPDAAATAPSEPVALPVRPDSTPNEVVMAFLNAMRDGNSAIAAELLTDQARAETTKHHWPVQPPGAPSATYQIGEPIYAYVDASQKVVQIPCLWSEPDGSGGTVQFQVTWLMRPGSNGWRVAGFSTEIIPGKEPYYFNFEDIAELKSTQAAAEAALSLTATAAESASAELAERPTQPSR